MAPGEEEASIPAGPAVPGAEESASGDAGPTTATRPLIEILDASSNAETPQLVDFSLDDPTAGSTRDTYAIHLNGWVIGKDSPAKAVRVYYQDELIRTMKLDYPRPGLAESHPDFADDSACGFNELVSVVGLDPEFKLNLRAVLEDDSEIPFRTIRVRHEPLRTNYEPRLNPIMLTSLPRTGTTRLMKMLGAHPGIVVYKRFPYEHNAAEYWAHMLKVLAEPSNTTESSGRELHNDFWWVGSNPFFDRHVDEEGELGRWFGRDYVERLATLCQQSMDEWYFNVGRRQGQDEPAYFAEKHRPGQLPTLLWELYPDAKEICLVRDPRDMVCSVFDFFGTEEGARARAESDEQAIEWIGGSTLNLYNDWRVRADRSHLLRYEDSIREPEKTLTALLEYLDLDSDPAIVQQMLDAAGEGTPSHFPKHETSKSPEASIGRWQRDLDPSLQDVAQRAFAPVLSGFGYS